MNPKTLEKFFEALEQTNKRDALMARLLYETKLSRESLSDLNAEAVKIKGIELDGTLYELPEELSRELRGYIKFMHVEDGRVFVTAKGGPLDRRQLQRSFQQASQKAGLKVTVEILRKAKP